MIKPYSLQNSLKLKSLNEIKFQIFDNNTNNEYNQFNVNYQYPSVGSTKILQNGDRLWRFGIKANNASGFRLNFKNIELKENVTLFIYDIDYKFIIGPYDSKINNLRDLLTPIINGNEIIIEYYIPKKYCGCSPALKAKLYINQVYIVNKNTTISNLKKGWNLISIINTDTKNIDFNNSTIINNIIYDFGKNGYQISNNLLENKGYWVYSTQDLGYINFY